MSESPFERVNVVAVDMPVGSVAVPLELEITVCPSEFTVVEAPTPGFTVEFVDTELDVRGTVEPGVVAVGEDTLEEDSTELIDEESVLLGVVAPSLVVEVLLRLLGTEVVVESPAWLGSKVNVWPPLVIVVKLERPVGIVMKPLFCAMTVCPCELMMVDVAFVKLLEVEFKLCTRDDDVLVAGEP